MALLRTSTALPSPDPLELPDTLVVAAGTLAWLVALVALVIRGLAGREVHGWWFALCLCGAGLGLVGLRSLTLRKARLRRS